MLLSLFKTIVVFLLTALARLTLWKYQPFIIAVTGSVGKTSTKDAIYDVLKDVRHTRKSEKSYNSELGIPLAILGLPNAWRSPFGWIVNFAKGFWAIILSADYPKVLVLEIGADHPEDIKKAVRLVRPDIAVITRLPLYPVHVEHFSSPEEVQNEKLELFRALPSHGVFVADGDDPLLLSVARAAKVKTLLYGWGEHCDLRGKSPRVRYEERDGMRFPRGVEFTIDWEGASHTISLEGILGFHLAKAALAALATGIARGESMKRMVEALEHFETPRGRMRIVQGAAKSTIIDDSYNSSPVAAEAALETLKHIEGKRKIALLGDMLELGRFSEDEHRRMGKLAGTFVDLLLTVGARAKWIADAAKRAGLSADRIHSFSDAEAAGNWMGAHAKEGDVILVKGSQGSGKNVIRLEKAVRRIMANPSQGNSVLVRQEKEWKRF